MGFDFWGLGFLLLKDVRELENPGLGFLLLKDVRELENPGHMVEGCKGIGKSGSYG